MTRDAILLVDDETAERENMSGALGDTKFQVFAAGDYDAALAAFELHGPEIRLLVVDVSLPGRNGCELAKALLQRKPDLRVLFVSGHVGAEVVRFYGIDASDLFFLRKPFSPETFADRVQVVLEANAPRLSVIMQTRTAG